MQAVVRAQHHDRRGAFWHRLRVLATSSNDHVHIDCEHTAIDNGRTDAELHLDNDRGHDDRGAL